MSLYKEIKKFDSYFNSVRIHEGLLIVDVILPTSWEDKKILATKQSNVQIKLGDANDKQKIVSFFSTFDADGVNELTEAIQNVIKWNKDLEEKNQLLNLKILELKKMFSENDVNSLRKLDFSFNKLDLEINGQEQLSKLVPEGVNQGQKGSN